MGHREKVYIDGELAASVTQVLSVVRKPFLEIWRGKLGNAKCEQVLKESQDIGHALHEAIEGYFQGQELPEMDPQVARMFQLFRSWALETGVNPIEIELNMESHQYKYYGTCDLIGKIGDRLLLIDWKTSSAIDKLHGVQLSAYAQMYEEQTGTRITDGLIVRIDKKEAARKQFEVKEFNDLPRYFSVFKACLEVHNFVNGKEK